MKTDPLDAIPQPLRQWIESQAPRVPSIARAPTFYKAAKVALAIDWRQKLDHFAALHTWATIALIMDERTRKYMSELIRDETEGLYWTARAGSATRMAMDELDVKNTTPPARLFRQRRDAAIKGLRVARENLAALETDVPLRDLLIGPDVRKFRCAVDQFTMVTSLSDPLKEHYIKVPHFSELIRAAEAAICNMAQPSSDRHNARSMYLREMFRALKYSAIESRRVAFLTYASEAVFGEHIEKRDIRRLVADLVDAEKAAPKGLGDVPALTTAIDAEL